MIILQEKNIDGLLSTQECLASIEGVFISMAKGAASNFPVIREAIGHADALYGFKSGFDRRNLTLGVKSGGFWPNNTAQGLTNHQSTVFLFDADSGQCKAMVGGNLLTALRTAAASAISIKYLARSNSETLGIVGAGNQSAYQLRAALEQRPFKRVVGWNYHPEMLSRLEALCQEIGIPFQRVELCELGARADVIITITSSFAPILKEIDVRPGTHIACMGTDTKGKQEVEAGLVAKATLFTDEVSQSISIGECQHAFQAGVITEDTLNEIGAVLIGRHPGRTGDTEITLYDGTGVGLQDLAVARTAVEKALAKGVAFEFDF